MAIINPTSQQPSKPKNGPFNRLLEAPAPFCAVEQNCSSQASGIDSPHSAGGRVGRAFHVAHYSEPATPERCISKPIEAARVAGEWRCS
jgi:hypothetical protein